MRTIIWVIATFCIIVGAIVSCGKRTDLLPNQNGGTIATDIVLRPLPEINEPIGLYIGRKNGFDKNNRPCQCIRCLGLCSSSELQVEDVNADREIIADAGLYEQNGEAVVFAFSSHLPVDDVNDTVSFYIEEEVEMPILASVFGKSSIVLQAGTYSIDYSNNQFGEVEIEAVIED